MSENDYIAEYVKENHPETIKTVHFLAWKANRQIADLKKDLAKARADLEKAFAALKQYEQEGEE